MGVVMSSYFSTLDTEISERARLIRQKAEHIFQRECPLKAAQFLEISIAQNPDFSGEHLFPIKERAAILRDLAIA
jgi:hypothetical protein